MPRKDKRDPHCFYLPKDAIEAEQLARDARAMWANRDRRMQLDQLAYEMRRPPPQKGELREQVGDCAIQVDAADDLMSSVDMQLNVATDEQSEQDVAQQAEDLSRDIWERWRRQYARQARPGVMVDICHSLNLYGWLCPRLLLNPHDRAFPYSLELLDPRRVYLDRPDGTPDLIVYYTQLTPREITKRWDVRTLHRVLPDADPDDTDPVDIIQYHTAKELAISMKGEWLKKPTEHEYPWGNPLMVFMAGGTTFRGPTPGSDLSDNLIDWWNDPWDERVGTGFLQTIRPLAEDGQRIADLRAELLGMSARPPTIDKLRATTLDEPVVGMGAWAKLLPEEGHEQHPPPAQALQFAVQLSQERANAVSQAGLNPVILGGGEAQASFDRFLLAAAGARTLRKRMDTLSLAIGMLLEACLQAYATWGAPAARYLTTDRTTGARKLVARLRPQDLHPELLRVECQFGEIGVPDLQGRATTASMLVREGLVSQYYALSEILRVRNPQQVIAESQRDQCFKIPQYVQLKALVEMVKNPISDVDGAIALELLPQGVAKIAELARPPRQPGPEPGTGGRPPGPPQGQPPPLPGSGLPSTPMPSLPPGVLPPPMLNPPSGPNGGTLPGPMPVGAGLPG